MKTYLRQNRKGDTSIESIRYGYLHSNLKVKSTDLGAGSRWFGKGKRSVSKIMRRIGTPLKFSLIYSFLCKQTPAAIVLDLGTSLGVNTAYLGRQVRGKLYSFEGDPELLALAGKHLSQFPQLQLIEGDLDLTLPEVLKDLPSVDFVLMDANHQYEPTLTYFDAILPKLHDKSIVVIADIHWSGEMKMAWEKIKTRPEIGSTIDFFDCGILFFQPATFKSHFVLEI
ncbi:O-methyltransferase [Cyclobacterium plantarum]|uniref:O-methyltransferase n=1 Tax=Cyclobacterium plantarum TaxID=2716263 RepID=UPI003F719457